MDLGFSRWDALRTDAAPAPLDYFRLIASLAAMQAGTRTAAVEATLSAGTFAGAHPVAALVRIFEAAPGWVEAVATLDGSFHPQLAADERALVA
jgi:hypothetical protein